MIPGRMTLRLCKVSFKIPFIRAKTVKKETIIQITVHLFRWWEL